MTVLAVNGTGARVGDAVPAAALGGEYLGWTGFPGWQNQAEHLGIHHIRWPAGINAEDRIETDGYAFDISTPTLVDNWPKSNGTARDGLAEMFAYANTTGASFALIVPSGRYVDLMATDPTAAKAWIQSDVTAFTTRLFAGDFGPIPPDFVLEIGAEYYSTDAWAALADDANAEAYFADVFAELVSAFHTAETAHGSDVYSLAVQAARFQSPDDTANTQNGELADADAFLAAYTNLGLEDAIDALVWHRYVYTFDQTSHHLTPNAGEHTLTDHLALWETALGHPLDLVLGWAAPDIDSNGDYPADPNFDFGPRAAHSMLQMFSELAEAGADYSTLYGIDSPWTGALTTGTTSADIYAVSYHGEVYALMTESLTGLSPTDAFLGNTVPIDAQNGPVPTDHANVYGFSDGSDQHTTFVAAWDLASPDITVHVAAPDLSTDFVTVTHLVPDGFDADASGTLTAASASIDANGDVLVTHVGDFDVLRITHTSDVDPNEADQTLLHTQTGRGLVSLSADADTFDLSGATSERAVNGHDGDDAISGSALADILLGGAGNDTLSGGDGGDILIGGGVLPDAILDWLAGDSFDFA